MKSGLFSSGIPSSKMAFPVFIISAATPPSGVESTGLTFMPTNLSRASWSLPIETIIQYPSRETVSTPLRRSLSVRIKNRCLPSCGLKSSATFVFSAPKNLKPLLDKIQRPGKGLNTVISGLAGNLFRKNTKKPFVLRRSLNIIHSVAAKDRPGGTNSFARSTK